MNHHLTDDDLGARVRAACEEQSGRLLVAERPFDPERSGEGGLPAAVGGDGRRRILLAAAAVVVVGALVAAVALARPDGAHDSVRAGSTTEPSPAVTDPTTWLAPSEPPLGLELGSVEWSAAPDPSTVRGQLFISSQVVGRVLVLVTPEAGTPKGDPGPTVQGHDTVRLASDDRSTRLAWNDGAGIDVSYTDMSEGDAVALLDSLRWRSPDHEQGFAPPEDRSLVLVREAVPGETRADAELYYSGPSATGGSARTQVAIHTSVAEGPSLGALQAELAAPAGLEGDDDGVRPIYDEADGTLWVLRPDGTAWIGSNDDVLGEADLKAVAATLVPTTETQLRALQDRPAGGAAAGDPLGVPLERLDRSATTLGAEADGRPIVAVLWAPWCVPCTSTLRDVEAAAADHPEALVVAVASQTLPDEAQAFSVADEIGLPILIDPEGALARAVDVAAFPTTVVLDPSGARRGSAPGRFDDPSDAQDFLDQHLD